MDSRIIPAVAVAPAIALQHSRRRKYSYMNPPLSQRRSSSLRNTSLGLDRSVDANQSVACHMRLRFDGRYSWRTQHLFDPDALAQITGSPNPESCNTPNVLGFIFEQMGRWKTDHDKGRYAVDRFSCGFTFALTMAVDAILMVRTPHNMVFTQSRGFVLGALLGSPCLTASVIPFDSPRRGHRFFGNVVSF